MLLGQPAMSNGLKRLRNLFNDPILVRTSDGMVPTERAIELQPVIRGILMTLEETLAPNREFEAKVEITYIRKQQWWSLW